MEAEGGIFLLLGSNVGDRHDNLLKTIGLLNDCGVVLRTSSVYVTAAWGNTNQPDFLNQVIEMDTLFDPKLFLHSTQEIEARLGRERTEEKWGPRTIDIDILFFRNQVIVSENLVVPHPQIQNRKFALVPLRELAPDFVHPTLFKTIAQLDDECTDTLEVKRLPPLR